MASHNYENVHLGGEEHDHDSRSSTEVESLIGDEKAWQMQHMRERSKPSSLRRIFTSSRWILDTTLLLIIVALLVRNEIKAAPEYSSPTDLVQLNGDMTGVGPRCSSDYTTIPAHSIDRPHMLTGSHITVRQKLTRFQYDTSYAPMNTSEFFTNETLDKWNDMMPSKLITYNLAVHSRNTDSTPEGMGFQWVNDTQKYHDLPKQIEWYEGMTVFTTSVTHQIHCLVRRHHHLLCWPRALARVKKELWKGG